MEIEGDIKLDFKDVLIKPKYSKLNSRSEVDLSCSYTFKHSKYTWNTNTIPIMVSNMDTTGTFEMAIESMKYGIFTCIHKHYQLSDWIDFSKIENIPPNWYNYISISSGSKFEDINKLKTILELIPDIKFICLDVANGYCESFIEVIKQCRALFPDKVIIAGSVVTKEMTEELINNGADIIKCGIGSGSVCTTRVKTGVGYPQLSAIIECSKKAHELNAHVIADGGCTCPGDFSKAFGAGADFVMSGGMFASHDEGGGELTEIDGVKFKKFYGMSSKSAMDLYNNGVSNYKTSEGKEVLIKCRGPVKNTIYDILGGIRSTCTYVGVKKLQDISKSITFIRVTQQVNEIYGKS